MVTSNSPDASGSEQMLIDFLTGHCDARQAEQVRRRLAEDGDFAALHRNLSNTFAALEALPEPQGPEDLVERTLARVRAQRQAESLLLTPSPPTARRAPLFSFRELAAVAAVLIIAFGVVGPSMVNARRRATRALCADNAAAIGTALHHYASGNGGALPAAADDADRWLDAPGCRATSNSAGLFVLARQRYANVDVFQCPAEEARPFAVTSRMTDFPSRREIGYSYQYSIGRPLRRDDPVLAAVADAMAILADRTPLDGPRHLSPEEADSLVSPNHRHTGQTVLYLDNSVAWATGPLVGVDGDNIYLAAGSYDVTGQEAPAGPMDTFLLPHAGP